MRFVIMAFLCLPACAGSFDAAPAHESDALLYGSLLTDSQRQECERIVKQNPEDRIARAALIGAYGRFARSENPEPALLMALDQQLLWVLHHHPEWPLASSIWIPWNFNSPFAHERARHKIFAELWLEIAASRPEDRQVLHNAAQFLTQSDPAAAIGLYERECAQSNDCGQARAQVGQLSAALIVAGYEDAADTKKAAVAARARQRLEDSEDAATLSAAAGSLKQYIAQRKQKPGGSLEELETAADQWMVRARAALLKHPADMNHAMMFGGYRQLKELPETEARERAVVRVDPVYTRMALWRGVQGEVHLKIVTDEEGNVVAATAVDGEPLLRTPAMEAAYQWRFLPVRKRDPQDRLDAPEKPAGIATDLTMRFTLPAGVPVPPTEPAVSPFFTRDGDKRHLNQNRFSVPNR